MWSTVVRLILLASSVAMFTATADAQDFNLDQFVGRDLWKQRPRNSDALRLYDLSGRDPFETSYERQVEPWHVWKTSVNGRTRYIFLLGAPLITIPGGSYACIQLFDASARRIGSWSFQAGWRIQLVDATFEYSAAVNDFLIVLHMAPVSDVGNVRKEKFAINNDRLRLVRVENDRADAIQNQYVHPYADDLRLAPHPASEDEWVALLESKDKVEVVSALSYLGERDDSDCLKRVLGDSRTRSIIEHLQEADNQWVKQAAMLAAARLHGGHPQ
jgi:hypothetical protein